MNAKPTAAPTTAQLIVQHKDQIAMALPDHVSADRMARIALTELRKTPALAKCDPYSFMGALIQAAQLGLEPGSGLGHAYLIPFGTTVQLIVGYQGMIDLAMRSGKVDSIYADLVYKGDEFDYFVQDGKQKLQHRPNFSSDRHPDDIIAIYAIAQIKGGSVMIEVMTPLEVQTVEIGSRKGSNMSPVWKKYWAEMAKKTVIRRLFKKLPKSVQMVNLQTYTATEHETINLRNVAAQYLPGVKEVPDGADKKTLDNIFDDEQSAEIN